MQSNKILSFTVESGLNTSYIDALCVSLFYKPSHIQNILSEQTDELIFVYLQEMIYHYFVRNMRYKYTIDIQIMNEIRNYMIFCGWKNDQNIIDLFEVQDLYDFLMNNFSKNKLIFNCGTHKTTQNYIQLNVNKNSDIKTMLENWLTENFSSYHLEQLPNYLPIFLNRDCFSNKINNSFVDIKEAIQLKKNNTCVYQADLTWTIHSIVCFSKTPKEHYYSLVLDEDSWYLYNSGKIQSLTKIDITDNDISNKIQKECVFIMYIKK